MQTPIFRQNFFECNNDIRKITFYIYSDQSNYFGQLFCIDSLSVAEFKKGKNAMQAFFFLP